MSADDILTVDLNCLRDLAQDGIYLRLPSNQPSITRNLSGKVMHAGRAIRLAERALALFNLRDKDVQVAENERVMARTPIQRGGTPARHATNSLRLRQQAARRERYALAYLTAVACAKVISP